MSHAVALDTTIGAEPCPSCVPAWVPAGRTRPEATVEEGARHDGGRMIPNARWTWELSPTFAADARGANPATKGRAYGDGLVNLEVGNVHGVLGGIVEDRSTYAC